MPTGLNFGSNGQGSTRFRFTGANLNSFFPATYIRRVKHKQQTGYYTHFFWGPQSSFTGAGFYGSHPYPLGPVGEAGVAHKWELSVGGTDYITDDNGYDTTVIKGRWYTQATRVSRVGVSTTLKLEYFWDIEAGLDRVITVLKEAYTTPASPAALTIGDAPWNANGECLSGIFSRFKVNNTALSDATMRLSALTHSNTPVNAEESAGAWYSNVDPTPTDISDKSGKGHNPAWVGANRPALYTESPQEYHEVYLTQSGAEWVLSSSAKGTPGNLPPRPGPAIRLDAKPEDVQTLIAANAIFSSFNGFIQGHLAVKGEICLSMDDAVKYLKAT